MTADNTGRQDPKPGRNFRVTDHSLPCPSSTGSCGGHAQIAQPLGRRIPFILRLAMDLKQKVPPCSLFYSDVLGKEEGYAKSLNLPVSLTIKFLCSDNSTTPI